MGIDPDVAAAINKGEDEYRVKALGQKPLAHTVEQCIPVVTTEPAILRIGRALQALVTALPGVELVSAFGSRNITFACSTDDTARAFAADLGVELREVSNATHRWLTSSGTGGDFAVYGPHHEIAPPPAIDETAVTAALAQAEVTP